MQVNVNYKNVEARRYSVPSGQININNNATLTNVSKIDDKLLVNFVFTCNYEPNIGTIRLEGEISMSNLEGDDKDAVLKWERTGKKELPKEIAGKISNVMISNCMIEATVLSREVQLPPPLPPVPQQHEPEIKEGKVSRKDTASYIR